VIPGRVRTHIERPSPEAVASLRGRSTGIVSDCLNRMGAMDGGIRRMAPAEPCVGVAVTVEEVEGGNLMTLVALDLIEPGDVLVIDAKRVESRAAWGGIQTEAALRRGAAAVIVDGAVRDVDEIERLGLPVYARALAPAGPIKGFGGNVNLPVACGGVVVAPGDVIVGDSDGVVVVPRELVDEVAQLAAERETAEHSWQTRLDAGESTLDILELWDRIRQLGVRFE
jgi:regulator of RNase E activity RraA